MENIFSRLALAPYEATVSKPETRPVLPYDVLHTIYTHCDIYTKRKLELFTSKAIFGHLRCTSMELADLRKIETSTRRRKLLFRAVVTKDNDAFVRQLRTVYRREDKYGLQLAVQYGNRHATWVLLALSTLEGTTGDEGYRELVGLARHQLDPRDLADITKLSEFAANYEERSFFEQLLKSDNALYYLHMNGLNQAALAFGLQLAGKYGYNRGAMVLLTCEKLYADAELKEIMTAAKKRCSPTELADLAKIRNSQRKDKRFFQSIIASDREMDRKSLHKLDGATHMFGLHLAVRYGNCWDAWLLLAWDKLWLLLAWDKLGVAECKELVNEAKSVMTPTELADIARIHKSNVIDQKLLRAIITDDVDVLENLELFLYENDDVLDFGIQLAVRRGSIYAGLKLVQTGNTARHFRNYKIGSEAAKERAEYGQNWDAIYSYNDDDDDILDDSNYDCEVEYGTEESDTNSDSDDSW